MPKSSSAGRDSGEPGGESGGAGIARVSIRYNCNVQFVPGNKEGASKHSPHRGGGYLWKKLFQLSFLSPLGGLKTIFTVQL